MGPRALDNQALPGNVSNGWGSLFDPYQTVGKDDQGCGPMTPRVYFQLCQVDGSIPSPQREVSKNERELACPRS